MATNKPQAKAPAKPDNSLASIQRKLDKWELVHLRQHALDLAERLDLAEQAITLAKDQIDSAQSQTDYWQRECFELVQELQDSGSTVGITQAGQLGVMA